MTPLGRIIVPTTLREGQPGGGLHRPPPSTYTHTPFLDQLAQAHHRYFPQLQGIYNPSDLICNSSSPGKIKFYSENSTPVWQNLCLVLLKSRGKKRPQTLEGSESTTLGIMRSGLCKSVIKFNSLTQKVPKRFTAVVSGLGCSLLEHGADKPKIKASFLCASRLLTKENPEPQSQSAPPTLPMAASSPVTCPRGEGGGRAGNSPSAER